MLIQHTLLFILSDRRFKKWALSSFAFQSSKEFIHKTKTFFNLCERFLRYYHLSTFIHLDKHLDRAWNIFWIKSITDTWPPKKSNYMQDLKVTFWQLQKGLEWPSRIPCWISRILFVLDSFDFLSKLEKALSFWVQSDKITACFLLGEVKQSLSLFFIKKFLYRDKNLQSHPLWTL